MISRKFRPLFFLLLFLVSCNLARALDRIILRDCTELSVKLIRITDNKVVYQSTGQDKKEEEFPTKSLYMVYIEDQGNVYFNEKGNRWTGESERVNRQKNDVVYLTKGAEIPADDIKLMADSISFKIKKKKGYENVVPVDSKSGLVKLNRDEVFMIIYKSGMVDIVTPLSSVDLRATKGNNNFDEGTSNEELKVVFHEVKPRETIQMIAKQYNVTVDQIVKWNSLKKSKGSVNVSAGSQLMIYTPKK